MRSARSRHGYTLVEMMVVVGLIGISFAAAAPGFSRSSAENRTVMAARELVRLGQRARSEASAYSRAYMLWIQPQNAGGTAKLIRGNTNSCRADAWNTLAAATAEDGGGVLETLDLSTNEYRSSFRLEMLFEPVPSGAVAPTATALCFAPNGVVWHDQPASLAAVSLSDTNQNSDAPGGYRFIVRKLDESGSPLGVTRRVVFPLGAAPRSLQ